MKKKILVFVGCLSIVAVLTLNVKLGFNDETQKASLSMQALKVLTSAADENYVCCSPYSVKCAEGPNVTIWGTAKSGTTCP